MLDMTDRRKAQGVRHKVVDFCHLISPGWMLDTRSKEVGGIRLEVKELKDDSDNDGIGYICENFTDVANSSQEDSDGDRIGSACDHLLNWWELHHVGLILDGLIP